ncbi:MAG: tetraacyldisaccharide 4'-kinase [Hyphomicrobiales bacterium]
MTLRAPGFWWQRELATRSKFLMPIGMIYGFVTARRMHRKPEAAAAVPVLCIGNLVVGGAGKTPTTISIAKLLQSKGYKCGFLLRGYGGSNTQPKLVLPEHSAKEVGDEALLYAAIGPTVVSADRPSGATLLCEGKIDVILMDDGFQNPSLRKDGSLLVVDSKVGWGNGLCFPAGPLRASLNAQLPLAKAVIALGQGVYSESLELLEMQHTFELLHGKVVVQKPLAEHSPGAYLAYSGIGRPQKFFDSLKGAGYQVQEQMSFPDHHFFSEADADRILDFASSSGAIPITTEKDHVRLAYSEPNSSREKLFETSQVLKIAVEFEDSQRLIELLDETISTVK